MDKTTEAEGLTDRIIREAKQFAFYNYCSAADNADFDNLETWPYAAQVAYYAISNYMSANPIVWPYSTKTIPMDLKDIAFETALEQWKGTGKDPITEDQANALLAPSEDNSPKGMPLPAPDPFTNPTK